MEKHEFFYRTQSPFSQWHPCEFVGDYIEDGKWGRCKLIFTSAEQYMMYRKAQIFRDNLIVERVMRTSDPKEIKAMGREVRNFNPDVWDVVKFDVVVLGNLYKFSQNHDLGKKLLETGSKILVEASPYDKVWGIGLDEEIAKKTPPQDWPGQNLLGKALMRARHIITLSNNL